MAALSIAAVALAVFAALLALGVVAGLLWLFWKALRGIFWVLGRALGFVRREVVDVVHTAGALLTALATVPLMGVNATILRLGAARHYGRAFVDELKGVGVGVWRVALGNPLRFVGLGGLVEVVESRLPDIMERAPRKHRARRATFDGYEVVGTLPSGGSGAQLFIARPKTATQQRFARAGRYLPAEVVIKSFALESGSTLPQIVRESRALEAASRLGLVCEHQLANDHFYYVMPYVKGEDLERVTRALHTRGTVDGLADEELRLGLGYGIDLLDSLQRFHSGGLWHKDVKPSNIIVAKGRAHLVDFGLVTPLASALTLTTHGTEYYRDPEMVRLAMQGVKVHEVDGVRFDVYSAGAVLYALLENSFPAHGSLSRISKRAPDALRWIVQRAMAEMSSRYASAAEMRADLATLLDARDPFVLRPADLPSFRRDEPVPLPRPAPEAWMPPAREPASPSARVAFEPAVGKSAPRRRGRRLVPALALTAAGMFGLVSIAGGTALLAGRARHHIHAREDGAPRSVSFESPARSWPSLSEREQRIVDLAQGVVEDLSGGADPAGPAVGLPSVTEAASPSRETDTLEVETAADHASSRSRTEPTAEAALPARGRILVFDDVTTSVDARVLSLLRSRLAARGFSVVGLESSDEASGQAIELYASARNAIGLGRAEEPETQVRLQRFLDEGTELDALILVSRPEQETEHLYRVFVRSTARDATTVVVH